jgi:hypothetical protein
MSAGGAVVSRRFYTECHAEFVHEVFAAKAAIGEVRGVRSGIFYQTFASLEHRALDDPS